MKYRYAEMIWNETRDAAVLEYEGRILCASVNHWDLRRAKTVGNELRDSSYGGTSHAGEYETLALSGTQAGVGGSGQGC